MRKFSNTVSVTCRCLRNIGGLSFPPCLFILILYCLLRLPGLSGKKLSLSALGFKPGSVHHCGVTDLLKEFLRLQIKKLCFASVKLLLGKKKNKKTNYEESHLGRHEFTLFQLWQSITFSSQSSSYTMDRGNQPKYLLENTLF